MYSKYAICMLFVDKTKWHNEVRRGQLHASVHVASLHAGSLLLQARHEVSCLSVYLK